jgi:hypothetical protein
VEQALAATDPDGEAAAEAVSVTTLHHLTRITEHRRSHLRDRHPRDMGRPGIVGHGDRASGLEQVLVRQRVMLLVAEETIGMVGACSAEVLQMQIQEDRSVVDGTMQVREVHGPARVLPIPQVGMKAQASGLPAVGDLATSWIMW